MANQPLRPAPNPIGLIAQFGQREKTIALKMRDTEHDYIVTDATYGNELLQVKHKRSMIKSNQTEIHDPADNFLYRLQLEHLKLHTTFKGTDMADNELFTIQSSFKHTLAVSYHNPFTQQDEAISLRGNFEKRQADIICNGTTIGRLARKVDRINGPGLVADKGSYFLLVAAGVDYALLAAFCVCLGAKEKSEQANGKLLGQMISSAIVVA